jgi:glycosyltransferase involved in cell wall biosynthesis
MRILFIVPYIPNQIRLRSYNEIRYLAERGHEVTVLTLTTGETEANDAAKLAELCHRVVALELPKWRSYWNCLLALPSRQPLQAAYCWQPALAREMEQLLSGGEKAAPFDVIHVEHLRGARYALHLKKLQTGIPIVWDSVDCISFLFAQAATQSKSRFGRFISRLDLARTRHFEGSLVSQFDHVLVTSPVDREALIALRPSDAPSPPISVLPIGVDLETFKPDPSLKRDLATIVVSGKMSYHANVTMVLHLAEAIMPLVWANRPDTRLLIVGKDPTPAVQKLATHPNVVVTGTVSAVAPYLQQATVSVAPVPYSAGIQSKVLEAMACAAPVVASPQAVKALTAVPDQDFLSADDPATFAHQILSLLNDPGYQRAIGENGFNFVKTHYHWRQIAANLEKIYQQSLLKQPLNQARQASS